MSVKEINIVYFCHKNNKLPVTFQQRVTYTHSTGPIPTQEPIPSNGLLTHPNYPLLLQRETSGKFRVIRSTFEGSSKEVSIRFRKRVCGKNDLFRERLFKNLKRIFKFLKIINVLSFKGTTLINPAVPIIYNFVFDDANHTYWKMNSL